MPQYRFYQLDVFTRTPLAGNPLAVFPEAEGLDASTMQALAREMNLSETTFVLPSTTATRRVRFFTPAAEIPLAGHPTIGTWWLLAELGALRHLPRNGTGRVTQETGRGVLPVDVTLADGRPADVVMTQAAPVYGPTVDDRAALAAAVGGDGATLADGPAPQVVSTALPQLMAQVTSRAALARLPSGGTGLALSQLLRRFGTDCVMLFALTGGSDPTAYCRMFAPGLAVSEDPATGSAAGALGAYLVRHGLVRPTAGTADLIFEQGVEIGRPSRIAVGVRTDAAGSITEVTVGGTAVRLITGDVTL
ncbi:MAG: PhzF family phenazine biosynthesis protein [Gemmatimonadota bacterium]|nr:PhzF family phenazine biosynthesis protein [Gemmatimonadota bacterium]